MSALWADDEDTGAGSRTSSRVNRGRSARNHRNTSPQNRNTPKSQPRRLSRIPFVLVLIVVFALGMGGLLALNTTLQDQSFQARSLHNRADKLQNREAALDRKSQDLRAPDRLAGKAWKLGLRPNGRPAVITLSNGKVIGKPESASKHAMPGINGKSAAAAKKQRSQETEHSVHKGHQKSHTSRGSHHPARSTAHEETHR